MAFSKSFIVCYKFNSNNLSYSITGLLQNYEFQIDCKKSSKLVNETGTDSIVCRGVSWWYSDIELCFNQNSKFNTLRFFKLSNCTGYKIQGLYNNNEIDWAWKLDQESMSYELINHNENNRVLAEMVDFTLRKKTKGKLSITDSLNSDLDDMILTTACLIWSD